MIKIKIDFLDGTEEYECSSRTLIKQDKDIQKDLKKAREMGSEVKCLCHPATPRLTIYKPTEKEYYALRRNHRYEHDESCPFYAVPKEFYDESIDRYGAAIFKEPQRRNNVQNECEINNSREVARHNTYRKFCLDSISEALSFAFNWGNKKRIEGDPVMYSMEEYFICLQSVVRGKKMINGESPFNVLPKNHYLSFGFIETNLCDLNDKELILNEYNYSKNTFWEKPVHILPRRLQITQKSQKIYNNIVTGPYLYVAVYKSDHNQNDIVRLYTYPIAKFGNSFCFVESKLERNYAENLFRENKTFIKPVSGIEYQTIASKYFFGERPKLKYRPDFIVFSREGIEIIEVCGFPNNQQYMKELECKEKHFGQLLEDGHINAYTRE